MTWRALCLTNNLVFRQGKCGPSSLAESLLSRQTRYQGCCCPFLEVQFWHSQISGIHCPCPMVQQGWQQARPEPCTECWVTELSSLLWGVLPGAGHTWARALCLCSRAGPLLLPRQLCPAATAPGSDLQGELGVHLLPSIEGMIIAQHRKLPQALSGFSGQINKPGFLMPFPGLVSPCTAESLCSDTE